ncbi:hypothetical protein [Amycolatopsis sp. NPDC098790]|uniref:hypothetical protein n=1 Tax=Amycolatopsis sp. NPDC098790 TaxID=3363939 RepID=UPI00380B4A94
MGAVILPPPPFEGLPRIRVPSVLAKPLRANRAEGTPMPTSRDRFQLVRDAVSGLGQRRTSSAPGDDIFARALPETVKVTERYHYKQEISRNASILPSKEPDGEIEIVVPFDGADHFTRQACDDVTTALRSRDSVESSDALIGHVLFDEHQKTDLGRRLSLDDTYGALPIRVPVSGEGSAGGPAELSGDRHACVIHHEYAPSPDTLELMPIDVHAELLDPDTVEELGPMPETSVTGMDLSKLSLQPNFQSYLLLTIKVRVVLPWKHKENRPRPQPVIDRISIDWPTITSLHALTLALPRKNDVPITYNPVERSIEWRTVPLKLAQQDKENLVFESARMALLIQQPGELYQEDKLNGQVEVKIPAHLLSGARTRLFDGSGRKTDQVKHEEVSWVKSGFQLILDDAFARRQLTPHQHLYFDEVIPEDARIGDIFNALRAKGFEVVDNVKISDTEEKSQWVLKATHAEGPDKMVLTLYVEGTRHETERQVRRGGQTNKTTFRSGELRLFMYGTLPRTSEPVTREMNALHAAIRHRFAQTRASH